MLNFLKRQNDQRVKHHHGGKYKILSICGITDNTYGDCILVEANPIEKSIDGRMESFAPYINNDTLRFIYPETESNISFLTKATDPSLWEVNFADFQQENINFRGKSTMIFRHISFYNLKSFLSDKSFFNGTINSSLISEPDKYGNCKIFLPNGDCYIGEIKDNIISGWGDYFFANGKDIPESNSAMLGWQHHKGNFMNGLPNGIGYYVSESRDYSKYRKIEEYGYFLNGKKNGVCFYTYEKILEVGIYLNDEKIYNLTEAFTRLVNTKKMDRAFWYKKLGLWIGIIASDDTDDFSGLLILNDGDSYLGTMPKGFNRTRIMGVKILADGITETGEWTLDIKGMKPTEWAFF